MRSSPKLERVFGRVRERVPFIEKDSVLSKYIESLAPLVREFGGEVS